MTEAPLGFLRLAGHPLRWRLLASAGQALHPGLALIPGLAALPGPVAPVRVLFRCGDGK